MSGPSSVPVPRQFLLGRPAGLWRRGQFRYRLLENKQNQQNKQRLAGIAACSTARIHRDLPDTPKFLLIPVDPVPVSCVQARLLAGARTPATWGSIGYRGYRRHATLKCHSIGKSAST
jgi:hypothetical protein